jgi:ATP-dependent Clp protease adaptor protein ClpS
MVPGENMRKLDIQNSTNNYDYKKENGSDTAVLDEKKDKAKPQPLWKVILYNSDHYFEEVEFQIQKATGCSIEVAQHVAMEADISGKVVAFVGEKAKCMRVMAILQQIQLIVTLEQD